jgi:hypothetical protein
MVLKFKNSFKIQRFCPNISQLLQLGFPSIMGMAANAKLYVILRCSSKNNAFENQLAFQHRLRLMAPIFRGLLRRHDGYYSSLNKKPPDIFTDSGGNTMGLMEREASFTTVCSRVFCGDAWPLYFPAWQML